MKKINNKKGFTLVELLVVLAIIGVLVGLAIAGMRIVQQVSRDTQRKAFISKDLQLALEAHNDRKNKYPETITFAQPGTCSSGETEISTMDGTTKIETICSKTGFVVSATQTPGSCTSFTGKEGESGNLTMCYDGQGKGYELMVKLERSDPYNAGNL